MVKIAEWIIENYQLIIAIGVLFVILAMTGNITRTYRAAKEGLKEAMTPMGFLIFLAIVYIAYLIYLSIMESFQ